ncbi:hypothetical protein PC9H_005764 [Pleurotus ostreatus]|uniref:Uncharacterized protein n=2 Tax=Pleurotus ostreatus TaxID=5322 RepID=A0A067NKH8_PLEO1|nr:uncharacterized protein PC9H_005764 [Pleurotus ostreatus]KAF7433799.1 hypothetical protein PC9H_005764 [Pleurotus ostreatus]KAJ8697410.1 hypothetical protein PTI98_004219 [Pleurotus ostreatus]KDQ28588.1 hypothetical protein PLEOSDRAFT_1102631 [Pleurotus ostreatus PC15]
MQFNIITSLYIVIGFAFISTTFSAPVPNPNPQLGQVVGSVTGLVGSTTGSVVGGVGGIANSLTGALGGLTNVLGALPIPIPGLDTILTPITTTLVSTFLVTLPSSLIGQVVQLLNTLLVTLPTELLGSVDDILLAVFSIVTGGVTSVEVAVASLDGLVPAAALGPARELLRSLLALTAA